MVQKILPLIDPTLAFLSRAGDGPGTVIENLHAAPDPGRKEAPGLQEMKRNERQCKEMS